MTCSSGYWCPWTSRRRTGGRWKWHGTSRSWRGADRHVIYGERAPEIVRYSQENGFDLMVLTSRRFGPEGETRNWATLSHKVAIMAQTPVLLVK